MVPVKCISAPGGLGFCRSKALILLLLICRLLFTPIVGVCNCSMPCCTLLYVHSSFAIILTGKRELVAVLSLSSKRLLIVVWLFLAMPWICLQFVISILLNFESFQAWTEMLPAR